MYFYKLYTREGTGKKLQQMIIVFMNLVVFPLIIIWTLAGIGISPLAYLIFRLFGKLSSPEIIRHFIWIYGRGWQIIMMPFVQFDKNDLNIAVFSKPSVIVINHRSYFDTYCTNMLPVSNVCFAVRAWPFKIYFYSLFMFMAEYINVENDDWQSILHSTRKVIKGGGFVLFFPEGHRSRDRQLTKFHSGAFRLALEQKIPLIPVCLTGTEELFPPGRYWLKPSKIQLKTLAPLMPHQYQGELAHLKMKKKILALYKENLKIMDENQGI